jgi:hypothetical protein
MDLNWETNDRGDISLPGVVAYQTARTPTRVAVRVEYLPAAPQGNEGRMPPQGCQFQMVPNQARELAQLLLAAADALEMQPDQTAQ